MCAVCTLFAWHGLSKYIEVKIKDKVANIRCPSKNYKQFLDPLFEGKSYQNHCLVSCVIFSASQPFYRLKKGATAQTVNDLWSYLINECQTVTQSKCPMCKKDFCFQCKTPWHAGYRCNESGQSRDLRSEWCCIWKAYWREEVSDVDIIIAVKLLNVLMAPAPSIIKCRYLL